MEPQDVGDLLEAAPGGVRLRVKVVPGASRDRLVGRLGDRLKVTVSAPPEGGRANRAVCRVLAEALGAPTSAARVVVGMARAQKQVEIDGLTVCGAAERLARALTG